MIHKSFFPCSRVSCAFHAQGVRAPGLTLALKGIPMKPESLHKVAETLRSSHHHHLGITTHPPKPPHATAAARLERADIQSFTSALDRAKVQWPDSDLCLIGAQGAIGPTNIDDPTDTLPRLPPVPGS